MVMLQVMLLQLLLVGSSVLAPQKLSGKSKADPPWAERDTGAKCGDYKDLSHHAVVPRAPPWARRTVAAGTPARESACATTSNNTSVA